MIAMSASAFSTDAVPARAKPSPAMVLSIAAFELRKRSRMLSSYVYFAVLFGCGLLSMSAAGGAFASVSVGLGSDKIHPNAPQALDGLIGTLSHFGVMVTAAVFGQAVYQDVEIGLDPLIFTTGVGKKSYLGGRFLGALAFAMLILGSIGLGLWAGTRMPFVDAGLFGDNRLSYYLWPYAITVLPNVFFTGVIFFSLAVRLRSMTPVYTGAVVFAIGYMLAQISIDPENRELAALLDPLGFRASSLVTRYWTVAEKNTLLIPLTGTLLQNRLLWLAVAAAWLALTFRTFRFAHGTERGSARVERAPGDVVPARAARGRVEALPARPSRSGPASLALFARLTWTYLRETVSSVYFGVIVLAGALFVGVAVVQLDTLWGTPTYPVTRSIIEVVGASFSLFMLVIVAFYAGELTFRERDAQMDSMTDALPVPTWLPFAAKLSCLLLVPAVLQLVVLFGGVLIQTVQGYHRYELGLYLEGLFGLQLVRYWLLAVLCFAIHAILQHKYIAHFAVVVFYMALAFLHKLQLEHNLYRYADTPDYPYSDMNGYGHLLRGVFWFDAYWAAGAALLVILAYLSWQRGLERRLSARWRVARARFSVPVRLASSVFLLAFALLGAFIYFNTNVLNGYQPAHEREQKNAEYEQRYQAMSSLPQPRVTGIELWIDIFPDTDPPSLRARGTFALKNKTPAPVSTVLVNLSPDFPYDVLRIGNMPGPTRTDTRLGVYTFELDPPLEPGATSTLEFDVPFRPRGFTNDTPWTSVVKNGTLFSSENLPTLGYRENRELSLDNERKKYGLAPKPPMAPASDLDARRNTYVAQDADWVSFEATVSTSRDQMAIAPGYLQREWLEGDRHYYHYAMDSPMLDLSAVLSARYRVKRDRWQDVALEIYYQPGHEYNLERMMQSMKDTLAYCTANFGPYQHRQVRILEFPRYERFAQSLPNTIPFSEAIGFIAKVDPEDPKDVDYPYYVTAHEVAHQWWAHQVIGGNVQGATMLSESMSQYTALMVMKTAFGPRQMKRYLRYELDRYLEGRGLERKREVPLVQVEDQQYVYYNKGSLSLYALQDYIGEDKVNRAARSFLESVKFQEPPYTAAPELLAFIRQQTPPELAYLVDDLFENITLYRNRVNSATYRRRDDGRYELRLAVTAQKIRADGLGNELNQPLADLIEVGAVDENGVAVSLEKHWIESSETELTLLVDSAPVKAGIDPLNKLIDREPEDNVMRAVEEQPVSPR
jgi:ABC-2 type transport system permease protein